MAFNFVKFKNPSYRDIDFVSFPFFLFFFCCVRVYVQREFDYNDDGVTHRFCTYLRGKNEKIGRGAVLAGIIIPI